MISGYYYNYQSQISIFQTGGYMVTSQQGTNNEIVSGTAIICAGPTTSRSPQRALPEVVDHTNTRPQVLLCQSTHNFCLSVFCQLSLVTLKHKCFSSFYTRNYTLMSKRHLTTISSKSNNKQKKTI